MSYDEREVPFDLLVSVPLNMGAEFIARSGLGDELNYVPVDKKTLQSRVFRNIFVIGDASDIPASEAGSVAHFAVDVLEGNLLEFNYDTEALPGTYPIPGLGPLRLLEEIRTNHLGKLAFRRLYWNVLMPGHRLPLPSRRSMAGKHRPQA